MQIATSRLQPSAQFSVHASIPIEMTESIYFAACRTSAATGRGAIAQARLGRALRHRRDVWAVGGSTKPWSPYSSGTYILRGAGRRFVSLDNLLDCQHGQVEILGDPRVQGVDAASWAHKVSDGTSNSPCVACADHPPPTPAGW